MTNVISRQTKEYIHDIKKPIMVEFSNELLTILTLISIAWTGITFIGVIIVGIVLIYLRCSKHRRLKSVKPIPIRSRSPSILLNEHIPSLSSVPTKSPIKYPEQQTHHYDTSSVINEHSYSYSNKNKYQQQEYMHDENDGTTTRLYSQHHKKRQSQSVKPMTDIRINDRHTPYPPDVIARERLMNNTRFSSENKY